MSTIILAEVFNGDTTEAEAFTCIDAVKEWIGSEGYYEEPEFIIRKLDKQIKNGWSVIDLCEGDGNEYPYRTLRLYLNYEPIGVSSEN